MALHQRTACEDLRTPDGPKHAHTITVVGFGSGMVIYSSAEISRPSEVQPLTHNGECCRKGIRSEKRVVVLSKMKGLVKQYHDQAKHGGRDAIKAALQAHYSRVPAYTSSSKINNNNNNP